MRETTCAKEAAEGSKGRDRRLRTHKIPLPSPANVLGVDDWINLGALWVTLLASSNALGGSAVSLPIPPQPSLAGGRTWTQFSRSGPDSPSPLRPATGVPASNALAIVVQP